VCWTRVGVGVSLLNSSSSPSAATSMGLPLYGGVFSGSPFFSFVSPDPSLPLSLDAGSDMRVSEPVDAGYASTTSWVAIGATEVAPKRGILALGGARVTLTLQETILVTKSLV